MHELISQYETQRHPSRPTPHCKPPNSGPISNKYQTLLDDIRNGTFALKSGRFSKFFIKNLMRKHCLRHHIPQSQRSPSALLARHLLHFDIFQEVQASPYNAKHDCTVQLIDYKPGHCPLCLQTVLTAVDTENVRVFREVIKAEFPLAAKLKTTDRRTQNAWKSGMNWGKVVPLWDVDLGWCVMLKVALLRDSAAKREMMWMVVREVCGRGNTAVAREFRFAVIKNLVVFRRKCLEEALARDKVSTSLFFSNYNHGIHDIFPKYTFSNIPPPNDLIALLFETIPLPKQQHKHLAQRLWRIFLDLLQSGILPAVNLFLTNPHLNSLIQFGAMLAARNPLPKAMILPGPNVSVSTWLNTSIGNFYVAEAVFLGHGPYNRIYSRLSNLRLLPESSFRDWKVYIAFCVRELQGNGFDVRIDTLEKLNRVTVLFSTGKWFYLMLLIKELLKISGDLSFLGKTPVNSMEDGLQQLSPLFKFTAARVTLDVANHGTGGVIIKKPWKSYVKETANMLLLIRILGNVPVERITRVIGKTSELDRYGKYARYFHPVLNYQPNLQDLARYSIRRQLGSGCFFQRVNGLDIPEKFKNFIFGDILIPGSCNRRNQCFSTQNTSEFQKMRQIRAPVDDTEIWADVPQRSPGPGLLSWSTKLYSPEMAVLMDLLRPSVFG